MIKFFKFIFKAAILVLVLFIGLAKNDHAQTKGAPGIIHTADISYCAQLEPNDARSACEPAAIVIIP